MNRKTAADFHPEVLRCFDKYVHGLIDRRGFLDAVGKYAVGGVTATMLLEALAPQFALAQKVAKDDPRINASYVEYASPQGSGTMRGYLVQPANATGKLPGILVVHENRGLNPHIEDIARRLALDNFLAFAPDGAVSAGRLSRRRGQGARALRQARSDENARGFRRRGEFPEGPSQLHRQDRRRRILLGRRDRQRAGDAPARSRCGRAVLRPAAGRRRCREDQGAAAHPLRGKRRADQRRLAGVRGRAEGGRRRNTRCSSTPGPSTASTTTRRRATTRRPRSSRGSGPSRSSTRRCEVEPAVDGLRRARGLRTAS